MIDRLPGFTTIDANFSGRKNTLQSFCGSVPFRTSPKDSRFLRQPSVYGFGPSFHAGEAFLIILSIVPGIHHSLPFRIFFHPCFRTHPRLFFTSLLSLFFLGLNLSPMSYAKSYGRSTLLRCRTRIQRFPPDILFLTMHFVPRATSCVRPLFMLRVIFFQVCTSLLRVSFTHENRSCVVIPHRGIDRLQKFKHV